MEEKNKTFHRKKTVWAFVLCLAAFLGLTGRLVYLMVYQSSYYTQAAQELHQRERNIKAKRGRIIDATGTVLADNRTVCNISVIHNQITDPDKVVEVLSRELGLEEEYVRKRVEKYTAIEKSKEQCGQSGRGMLSVITSWTASRWMRTIRDIIPLTALLPRSWALREATTRELWGWRSSMTNISRENRERS